MSHKPYRPISKKVAGEAGFIPAVISAPPSKSITHRALLCAALAKGTSTIRNPLDCKDTQATLHVLEQLGVAIEKLENQWRVYGGSLHPPVKELFCNESGTTYRFLTAITETLGIPCTLTGKPSLLKRPKIPSTDISSQFLSGQLLAAPLAKKETVIELTKPLVSKPYVELTLAVQKAFGVEAQVSKNFSKFVATPQEYQPTTFTVEGDWSSAAYLLGAGLVKNGIILEGLNPESLQGDKAIVTILKEMGGDLFWEKGKLIAHPSKLKAIRWDFSQTPDLYPIVAVLSYLAEGKGQFNGLERLSLKESNRLLEVEKLLHDSRSQLAPSGAPTVTLSDDHRIVMAAAVLNLATGGRMVIKNRGCVAKSFPDFWKVFESI